MLIILILALLSINNISAATGNQTGNITNTSEIQQNNTNITNNNNTTIQSSSKTTNNSNITNNNSTTQSNEAAGGSSYSKVKGIWLKAEDVNNLNVTALKNLGITDVFVKTNLISTPTYPSVLTSILQKLQGTNIRVHAWITCFIDANGNWVNPANTTQQQFLINSITTIVKNYDIDGINLDYVRYPGTAYKYTDATGTITSFVQRVYDTVKSLNSSIAISADVMPEGSANAYYYGQDYAQLAKYLDFMVPMVYKGNYGYISSTGTYSTSNGTAWIGRQISYIVSQAGSTPVIAGLQTYRSDSNVTPISASELQNDINAAINNGSSGYALFRYGLINSSFSVDSTAPTVTSVDPANNSVNVPINKTIKITFSEPVKAGTLSIGLKDMNTGAYKYITKTISGNTLTITFTSSLTKATQYFLILGAGCITDLAGNPINAYGTTFTTDGTAPTITSVDPTNNSVNVPINKTIKITFSEPVKAGTLSIGLKDMNTGAYKYITKTISGNTLTITFTSSLTKATQYFLILGAGCITDLAGNPINAYGTTFTTNGTIDSTAPTVTSVDPANNSVNIPINKTIKITFSEPVKAGTLSIGLKDMNTGAYKYITKTISGNTLTITFTSNLTKATQYFLILGAGCITDLAGNPINAYGTTFTTNGTNVTNIDPTIAQVSAAAASVKSYIETNHKLPNYVTIGSSQVTMPQFLQLLVTSLLQINNGTNKSMVIGSIKSPTSPTGSYMYGNIELSEYLSIAQKIKSYINSNNSAPNYMTSSLGNIQYESLIYSYSKILNFYKANGRLPTYVLVDSSVTNTAIPSELQQYLQATTNCQVTNSQIQALAKSLTSGKSSAYDKAVAIFNWVRDNIGYSFYYNTKYGAVGTLNAKTGNCVDTAHLLIALERAAGIPARYEHVKAKFSSGNTYGHVIAQVWVNGKWYNADATSYSNTFGVIKNWDTSSATYYGTYATLPF